MHREELAATAAPWRCTRTADTVQQAAEAIEQSGGRAVAIAADVTEDGAQASGHRNGVCSAGWTF